jgi:hypothetical protein
VGIFERILKRELRRRIELSASDGGEDMVSVVLGCRGNVRVLWD